MDPLRQAAFDGWCASSPGKLGRAEILGPVRLGRRDRVGEPEGGATTLDVNNLATIASVDAQTPFSQT